MTTTIEVTKSSLASIYKGFDKVIDGLKSNQLMNIILQGLIDNIKIRTRNGLDKNLKPFKPYAKSYAEEKGKTRVDMTDTGRMLKSMAKRATGVGEGIIYFNDADSKRKAEKHNVIGVGRSKKIREFFGLSIIDTNLAKAKYLKEINKLTKEFNRG